MSVTDWKTTQSTLIILKQNVNTMLYCFKPRLMNHIMMNVISEFIASIFVVPNRPIFDWSNHLEIICPDFVKLKATQGSRSCHF